MNFLYFAPVRLPSERAHGKQIMKTCEGLTEQGCKVTLLYPARERTRLEDPWIYYGIRSRFTLVKIQTPDWFRFGKLLHFFALALFFVKGCRLYSKSVHLAYSRVDWLAYFSSFFFPLVIWEAHEARIGFSARLLSARPNVGIIAITRGILDVQHERGIVFQKETVVPDAVDTQRETVPISRIQAIRMKLGLHPEERVMLYAGSISLYPWKGVDLLVDIAAIAPSPWRIVIVGGDEEQILSWKRKTGDTRCLWHPAVPPMQIGDWYALADAFILPNKAGNQTSERFTSPMKLFEYLGEGKPILATRLPSIEEVVTDREVWFMSPEHSLDDASAFFAAADSCRWDELGRAAREKSHEYTWEKRAERIMAFANQKG